MTRKKDQAEMVIHTLQEFSVFDLVSVLRLWHLYGHQIQFLAKFGPNWPDTSLNMITWLRFIKSKGMCKLYLDSTQPGVWNITASWATTYTVALFYSLENYSLFWSVSNSIEILCQHLSINKAIGQSLSEMEIFELQLWWKI